MEKSIYTLVILLMALHVQAQEFRNQRTEFIATNIGINGVMGGIGALTNIKKDQKPLKVFIKGFGQGCLGGAFNVLGKNLTYQINSRENLGYAWPARITNAIGNSITQNAASNINFWERWHFNVGFVRFDYHVPDHKFQARVFASSLYGIYVVGKQARFDIKTSLQTGMMIYTSDNPVAHLGSQSNGIGVVSSIGIQTDVRGQAYYSLMAHETMHIMQYDNMVWLNSFFDKADINWKAQSGLYRNASKYVYFDLNGLTILGVNLSQIKQPWECRYLEREADNFSRRVTMPDCD